MAYKSIRWQSVGTVHYYTAIPKNNEVDCRELINKVHLLRPDIVTATWVDNNSFLSVTSGAATKPKLANDILYDVIIVPLLGFNSDRHRLGYGGGFYDRFLQTQTQAFTVGLCYANGKLDELPVEDHDVALKMIITENGLV